MFQSQCSKKDCVNVTVAKGLCSKHYQQQRSGKNFPTRCKVRWCNKKYHAKGFCRYHYKHDLYIKGLMEEIA